jgi:ABC-type enterochelin transport system substrate-binding protein
MKKSISLIVLLLVLEGTALAQLMNAKSRAGSITAHKGDTITIKDDHRELVITLTEETHVIMGSDFKTAGDLQIGDRVKAVYREKGNQKTALVITILSKK